MSFGVSNHGGPLQVTIFSSLAFPWASVVPEDKLDFKTLFHPSRLGYTAMKPDCIALTSLLVPAPPLTVQVEVPTSGF
jgi:hypothetical protein